MRILAVKARYRGTTLIRRKRLFASEERMIIGANNPLAIVNA
jgi:hypothetical protein